MTTQSSATAIYVLTPRGEQYLDSVAQLSDDELLNPARAIPILLLTLVAYKEETFTLRKLIDETEEAINSLNR